MEDQGYIKEGELKPLISARQQKALDIATAVIGSAFALAQTLSEPIPYVNLLRKRPFPDRKIPERIQRQRKKEARCKIKQMHIMAALRAATGAAQRAVIAPTPIPRFQSGTKCGSINL